MYKQIDSNKQKSLILVALFIGLIAAVGYVYSSVAGDGYVALTYALVVSTGYTAFSWFAGSALTLWSTGAREITDRNQNMMLWNLVENLAITVGIPKPRIFIIADDAPNAFATGRDPQHASIAVTEGLLHLLTKEELEGVIAHELSHVGNYDIRWMMLVGVLVGALSIIGDTIFRHGLFGGRRSSDDRDNPLSGPLMIVGILFIVLSPLIGQLIQLAVSRKREYLADASGALLTRYPEGLASALEKIRDTGRAVTRAPSATAHLWISDPRATNQPSALSRLANLFSTHPPIDDRIAQLRGMKDAQ